MQALLTDEQMTQYHRDGYLQYGRILTDEELASIRDYFEDLLERLPSGARPEHMNMPHVGDEFLLSFCSHPRILDVIERFIGPNIVLFASHFICKPKGDGKPVPWHQDATYWPLEPMKVMTLWLAIDDSTVENGCMRVIPGTHKLGPLPHQGVSLEQYVLDLELPQGAFDESQAVDVELKAGECSFHEPYLIHGSNPNFSDKRRCGYTMRFMPVTTKLLKSPRFPTHPLYLLRGEDKHGNNVYVNVP